MLQKLWIPIWIYWWRVDVFRVKVEKYVTYLFELGFVIKLFFDIFMFCWRFINSILYFSILYCNSADRISRSNKLKTMIVMRMSLTIVKMVKICILTEKVFFWLDLASSELGGLGLKEGCWLTMTSGRFVMTLGG